VTLQKSLDFLYGLQRFGIKLGLENIRTFLQRLGHPQADLAVVQVAGTNGKGSVCASLAEILGQAGHRVGLYTSPHLQSFTERIRIAGQPIAPEIASELIIEIRQVAAGLPLTFFEFTTAMALLHFQRQKVDLAILEVGMGGRLDATSVVHPHLGIITPVSFDHTEHLGSTLAAIAAEKAGILKEQMPVVIAEQAPEVLPVLLAEAQRLGSPVCLSGRDFHHWPASAGGFSFSGPGMSLDALVPGLEGLHQHGNMSVALAAASLLRRQGWSISDDAMRAGVERVCWPGRLEWWRGRRTILLDGAHNPAGAKVLAEYLAGLRGTAIHWVVGVKGDKPLGEILAPVLPLVAHLYAVPLPVESCCPPAEIVACGKAGGVSGSIHDSCAEGLQSALARRQRDDVVLVAGSLFLVAAARDYLMAQKESR
jgi:dihydrofolate synthase / folylpolyglutamate synthase